MECLHQTSLLKAPGRIKEFVRSQMPPKKQCQTVSYREKKKKTGMIHKRTCRNYSTMHRTKQFQARQGQDIDRGSGYGISPPINNLFAINRFLGNENLFLYNGDSQNISNSREDPLLCGWPRFMGGALFFF